MVGHNYSLRRITSTGKGLPPNAKQMLHSFIDRCSQKVVDFNRSSIYNMDETAIELDSP